MPIVLEGAPGQLDIVGEGRTLRKRMVLLVFDFLRVRRGEFLKFGQGKAQTSPNLSENLHKTFADQDRPELSRHPHEDETSRFIRELKERQTMAAGMQKIHRKDPAAKSSDRSGLDRENNSGLVQDGGKSQWLYF